MLPSSHTWKELREKTHKLKLRIWMLIRIVPRKNRWCRQTHLWGMANYRHSREERLILPLPSIHQGLKTNSLDDRLQLLGWKLPTVVQYKCLSCPHHTESATHNEILERLACAWSHKIIFCSHYSWKTLLIYITCKNPLKPFLLHRSLTYNFTI